MTDIVRSLLLGIIQGLTEFVPVSSSGHLELLNHFLGSSESVDSDLTMVILVHAGTAFSILYVFRKDILELLIGAVSTSWNEHNRFITYVIVSMIPALIIGLTLEDQVEALFSGGIWKVGAALIVTGLVLWATPESRDSQSSVSMTQALLIGVAQAIAIMPGISRSGMTIAVALMLGIGRQKAARFSFLMVLPVILGKMLLDLLSGEFLINSQNILSVSLAFFTALFVGILACKWMLKIVQQAKLKYFSWYCIAVGLIAIGVNWYG